VQFTEEHGNMAVGWIF